MKRVIVLVFSLLFFVVNTEAHPWKPSSYVIIDTDGGVDDMRAISMLLASRDVRVLAITVSPGSLGTDSAYLKVKSMLNAYYHQGIPVGINRTVSFKSPQYLHAATTVWGETAGLDPASAPEADKLIGEILNAESTPIKLVCLAGLSIARQTLEKIPGAEDEIKEIIWVSNGVTDTKGFNYSIDKQSVIAISKQTAIPFTVIKGDEFTVPFWDNELVNSIEAINKPYGKKLFEYFAKSSSLNHQFSFTAYDEMAALYLHFPELFAKKTDGNTTEYIPNNIEELRKGATVILNGSAISSTQIMRVVPTDPSFYSEDMEPYVGEIIAKWGDDEWFSGIIASELHRHLGVFAIIGVKMGIRAREYFNTGVDEFTALSYAGSTPPLSCMNDGVQVSTGATPGHGLLTVSNAAPTSAKVDFTYLGKTIRVSLLPEIAQQISAELKEINFVYGLDSNIYWELVRKNTLKYWLMFDRHEIFTIEEI